MKGTPNAEGRPIEGEKEEGETHGDEAAVSVGGTDGGPIGRPETLFLEGRV